MPRHCHRLVPCLTLGLLAAAALAGHDADAATRTRKAAVPRSAPAASGPASSPALYGRREDLMRFAAEVAQARQLDLAWVESTLAGARFLPAVTRLIMPPPSGTAKDWSAYRARFVEPQRIGAGVAFWNTHQHWLDEAERRFGVPSEIVVGIVGVETFYGRMTGSFRTLDALATLGFDFPPGRKDRSAFFRDELAQFLVMVQREGIAPQSVLGSYAGAIGLAQFMPGSILKYAIDFDGDGRIDVSGNPADVVGSVAHYLASFGWKPGLPTHHAVLPPTDTVDRATLLLPDIVPSFLPEQMTALGAVLDDEGRGHGGPLALVELHNGSAAPSFVAGTQNFYALTRYNWSSYYAMAVIELGRAIRMRREAALATPAVGASR